MTEKTLYYTAETIENKSQEFLTLVENSRSKHPLKIAPEKTALLVIDMQYFFYHRVLNAPAIVNNIKQLQKTFLARNLLVIQTKHTNTSDDCGQMRHWWGNNNLLAPSNPEANIISPLSNPNILILPKTQYDAFWRTNLEELLQTKGITQLIITGIMAHLCCETTARAAFVRNFEVFFSVDATATHNQDFHLGTLKNLAHGFALPVLTAEIIAGINHGK